MSSATLRSDVAAEPGRTTDAARLFEQHSERILGYCVRELRCRAEAEDAVQTTFLYAHRALVRGIVPASEYAWLHAIAKNVCRWQRRTIARRGRLSSEIDLDTLPGRDGEGDEKELLLELEEALTSIPETQRRALLLREWQGLTSQEVAEQLGMSATATYALLTRARRSVVRAMTTTPRVPTLSLDFGALFLKVKGLLFGGAASVAATTAVVAGVVVGGGVALEQRLQSRPSMPPAYETPSASARDTASPTGPSPAASVVTWGGSPLATLRRSQLRPYDVTAGSSTPAGAAAPAADPADTPNVPGPAGDPNLPDAAASDSTPKVPTPVASLPSTPSLPIVGDLPVPPIEPLPLPAGSLDPLAEVLPGALVPDVPPLPLQDGLPDLLGPR